MEIWKDVKGYENLYQVSNKGRVKTLYKPDQGCSTLDENNIKKIGDVTKHKGYCLVQLYKDGKKKMARVHRLVAEAFIPNPMNYPQVNHIDGNKTNNCVENLEWCSGKHNMEHAAKHHLLGDAKLKKTRKIQQLTLDGEVIATYKSIRQAALANNISRDAVTYCVKGLQKSTRGFMFKYL